MITSVLLSISLSILAAFLVACVYAFFIVNEPRRLAVKRAKRGEPVMVPMCVARPAVTRRKPWSEWRS